MLGFGFICMKYRVNGKIKGGEKEEVMRGGREENFFFPPD